MPALNLIKRTKRTRVSALLLLCVGIAGAGTIAYRVVFASNAPPPPSISSGPSSPTSSTSAKFTFTDPGAPVDPDGDHDTDPVKFTCSLDGSAFSGCSSPKSYAGLADGVHTFQVTAQQEGTGQSNPASASWTVRKQPPTVALTFPANNGLYSTASWDAGCAAPGACGSANDTAGVTQVQVSVERELPEKFWDGSSFSSSTQLFANASLASPGGTSTTWAYAFSAGQFPANGTYIVNVRATDSVGNQTSSTNFASATFTIETAPPPPPVLTKKPSNPTTSTSATLSFKDSEAGVSFTCSLDHAGASSCGTTVTYSGLGTGGHHFEVTACDAAGNCSSPTAYDWTVGKVSQTFGISGNAVGTFYPGAPGLSINLIISNPFSTTLTVNSANVTVTGTSVSGCGASNFSVVQNLVGSVNIPPNTTESLSAAGVPQANWPQVQMVDTDTNQDACHGATVHFSYSGSGTHS